MSGQQPPPYPDPQGQQPPGSQPPEQQPPPYPGPPAQPPPYPGQYGQPPGHPPPPGQQPYPTQYPQQPYQHPQQPYQGHYQQQYAGYPQQPGYAPAAKEPVGSTARMIGWMIAATGVLVAIAAFLTWFSIDGPGGESADFRGLGLEEVGPFEVAAGSGLLTLILAVPAIGFAIARGFGVLSLTTAIIGVVMGALITLIAVVDGTSDEPLTLEGPGGQEIDTAGIELSVGIGLWFTLVGGIAMALVSIFGIAKRR